MEPALLDGDELWVKYLEPAKAKAGDIVALQDPVLGQITHRLVSVESLPNGSYLLVTKGDANQYAEEWEISADETVGVMLVRVHFVGYIFEFLHGTFGTALLGGFVATVVTIWLLRVRMKRRANCKTVQRIALGKGH